MPAQAGEGGNILGITLSRVMASPPSPEAFLSLWRNSLGIFAHFYGPTIRTAVADPTNPVNQWLVDTYAHCLATIYKDGPHQDPALAKDFTTWRDQQALQLLLPQAALGALHASEAAPLPHPPLAASSLPHATPVPPRPSGTSRTSARANPQGGGGASASPTTAPSHTAPPSGPSEPAARHVLFRRFTVPYQLRQAIIRDATVKTRTVDAVRQMLKDWGFDPTLVQQAAIYVLPRSGDVRLTLPDHATALAFLDGTPIKPVQINGQPVIRSRGEVVAHLHTPPAPATTDQQGYKVLTDIMRSLSPHRSSSTRAPTETHTTAPAASEQTSATLDPNANGLQEPASSTPAGHHTQTTPPPASPPTTPVEVEMTDATSRSRTSDERSPESSPPHRRHQRPRTMSPPRSATASPPLPPASPSATAPEDSDLDSLLGLLPQ